jgi:stage II sporulation protein D
MTGMYLTLLSGIFFFGACVLGMPTNANNYDSNNFNSNTPLRVLLDKGRQEILLKSMSHSLFAKNENSDRWISLPRKLSVKLSKNQKHLLVNGNVYPTSRLYFRGGSQPSDPIQYGSALYRGALKVSVTNDGLLVTNVIPLEQYLQGMLAGEMSPSWEIEALKAQAIAARTYALYMIQHPKSKFYDLEKGTGDQVYLGADGESIRVRAAVEATRNQVITLNNHPVKTYFHSRCGGATEPATQVWNKLENSSQSVPCPYCRKFPYPWKSSLKTREFLQILRIPEEGLKKFKISIGKRTLSGRVKEIAIESEKEKHLINSEELRHLLGYSQIKSTHFDLSVHQDEITFQGVGAGHGVGMCQWGAQFLAKQGKNYREILSHYYPNFELQRPQLVTNP